jgi:hypothetical protein
MSASENLGPHLLGRRPSEPDPRDYQLGAFLSDDPLDAALTTLMTSHAAQATKAWAKIATARIHALEPAPGPGPTPTPPAPPTPNPTPPAAPTAVVWGDTDTVLDQGQTPHCVGFGSAQWGNTLPIDDHFTNADGDAIYYECKVIDGEPNAEDGSDVRSAGKALRNRQRVAAYAFAASIDEACQWVLQHGPVIMGTDWTNDMFNPDAQGFVKPSGGVAGGHCYVLLGYDPDTAVLTFLNSWGSGWAENGRFHMHKADAVTLFKNKGEALAAVELP